MIFSDLGGPVACLFHLQWQADSSHGRERSKLVKVVRVPILAIPMIVEAGKNHRATG